MGAPTLFNDKKHLGMFSLIWLDQNANLSQDIEQSSEQNRLILIVNDEFGKIINHFQSRTRLNIPFLFLQIFLDSLLKLKSNENDENNLIYYLQHEYQNNPNELNNIQEFKENYLSNKVLWWYKKRDFFFSSILNASLKTENLSMMFLFRSFLFDIQEQLRKYQSKQRLKVYRIIYQLIHFYLQLFLSTTTSYTTACSLIDQMDIGSQSRKVIFEIDADPNIVTSKPFSDIRKILSKMGKNDLAEKYFQRLIEQLSTNDPLFANLYEDLSQEKGLKEGIVVAGGPDALIKTDYAEGLSVNHLGEIFVADNGDRKITCWSPQSKNVRVIVGANGKGYQPNQLNWPKGITFDRQNNLYVADSFNHRVQRFEIDNS
ncbi:unnamed protein product [Adineta steineri]|uniref:NHL repeat containing protein n=1 Tax=Adineta steineri TaxID=433720 RepID=A0A813SHJ5_9BILA|nr:unnamed protein product [Adineta steineri]CAF0794666.1 unnamed protein product [Adineta steineri]